MTESLTTERTNVEKITKQLNELTDRSKQEIASLKLQIDGLEQEKLRLTMEVDEFNQRDQNNLHRTNELYDEIQKVIFL